MIHRTIYPIILLLFLIKTTFGQEEVKYNYSSDEVYQYFEQISPEDLMNHTWKGAQEILNGNEEELFKEIDKSPVTKWNKYPLGVSLIILNCENYRVKAHPLSKKYSVLKVDGFGIKFRDINGKRVYFRMCNQVTLNPRGVWVTQENFWPETRGEMKMGLFIMQIPGTPYQAHSFYPTRTHTEKQLNNLTLNWISKTPELIIPSVLRKFLTWLKNKFKG